MAKALSVKAIERIKPTGRRVEIGDGGATGLRLVVQPSGSMTWVFRYRSPVDTRPKKYTIGPIEAFTLSDAREVARDLHRVVVKDKADPGEQKKAAKARAADTSREVGKLLDRFIEKHVDQKRPTTAKLLKQQIEADIRPAWGRRRIETITRADVAALAGKIAGRGATVSANRVFSTIRKFLNWCVDPAPQGAGVLSDSPIRGMARPVKEEKPRDRVLKDAELRVLWQATGDGDKFTACVRLLILTGQRRMEVGGMRWSELFLDDKDQPFWSLPASRTKNKRAHMVPLCRTAVSTLRALPRIKGSDLVFTTDGETVSSGWSKAKRQLDEAAAKVNNGVPLDAWTLHDLRRTCATGLAKLRHMPHVIEAALNHASGQVSGIARTYNVFEYRDEIAAALADWERHVLALAGEGGDHA